MLFPEDSPLRHLPIELNERQAMFIDGIRYAVEMAGVAYGRLRTTLAHIGDEQASGEIPNEVFPAGFLDAWAMVDSLHRLRLLTTHMRGVKRTPELKVFLKNLEPFENMRHAVQHLNRTIESWADKTEPTWGSLSWIQVDELQPVFRFRSFVLMAGAPRKTRRPAINPIGREFEPPVDLVELTAFEETVSLSAAFRSLEGFAMRFSKALQAAFETTPGVSGSTRGSDFIISIEAVSEGPAEPVET